MIQLKNLLVTKTRVFTLVVLSAVTCLAHAGALEDDSATLLRARYSTLQAALSDTEFRRPIRLESSDIDGSVTGEGFTSPR